MSGDTIQVLLAATVVLLAVLVGWAWGGRVERLGLLPLHRGWLVAVALAAQVGGGALGGRAWGVGLAISAGLVLAFLLANRLLEGTALVALGLLSNALVVAANGAMPVYEAASGRARVSTQELLAGTDPRHELAGSSTAMPWLGDVVPVLLPWHPEVVSPGDVLVAAGLAQLIVVGMTRRDAAGR